MVDEGSVLNQSSEQPFAQPEQVAEDAVSATGGWKDKKFVRKRKTKKEREDPLVREIRLTVESGKVEFGFRKATKNALFGKVKLFVVAENTPKDMADDVKHYASLSNVPVIEFKGTSVQLGSICGKPFPITVLSVFDEGNSDILSLVE